jgi:hypothetical protein
MGNILIFVILAVTIPRWALTLAQVDTFGVAGVPLAAIGEAIVLEFGVLYILSVFNRCRTHALQYQAEWAALNQRNIEQGKKTRKPPEDARMGGYLVLPAALLVLEILTIASQTPFIAGQLMSESAVTLLNDWGISLRECAQTGQQDHSRTVVQTGHRLFALDSPGRGHPATAIN